MKRVLLFLGTNIAVLVVLGIVLQLLGVDSLLDEQGVDLDLRALLIFSAVYGMGYFVVSILAQIVLGILASTIVMWFSRQREFRADAGAARLAGANRMVAALERLKAGSNQPLPDPLNAFGISGGVKGGLAALFASHPPLDERIARLRAMGG